MTEGLSPADIAAVQGGGFGGFGNEGLWLFAILALMGGGFGNWGNRGTGDRNATVGDVQRATDFAALERQNNETVAAVRQAAYDNQAAVKDGNTTSSASCAICRLPRPRALRISRSAAATSSAASTASTTMARSTPRASTPTPPRRRRRSSTPSRATAWRTCRTRSTSSSCRQRCAASPAPRPTATASCRSSRSPAAAPTITATSKPFSPQGKYGNALFGEARRGGNSCSAFQNFMKGPNQYE